MSMNENGANQSAAATTDSANQSTMTTETATGTTDTADHSDTDFGKELDAEWGLATEDTEEEAPAEEELGAEDEVDAEQVDDVEEPPAEETQTEDSTAETTPQENTLRVNYMGQTYNLPEDEARKYAQIGMNAGRLQEKYDALKPMEKLKDTLEIMSVFRGQDVEKLINELSDLDSMKRSEIGALVEQGTDESVATELWESKINQAKKDHELNKMKRAQTTGLTQYQKDQIDAFAKFRPAEHEAISAGKPLPQEVVDEWRSGTDLSTAWLLYENKGVAQQLSEAKKQASEYKKELETLKKDKAKLLKNAENHVKAPTRKKGTGGGAGGESIYSGWDKY